MQDESQEISTITISVAGDISKLMTALNAAQFIYTSDIKKVAIQTSDRMWNRIYENTPPRDMRRIERV